MSACGKFLLWLLALFFSFLLGMTYALHGLESDIIGYLEQHGCPIQKD